MAIVKKVVFEELLIRGDGEGGIKGAHYCELETISEDGKVIASKIGAALPVSVAAGNAALQQIIGVALNAAIQTTTAKDIEITALKAAAQPTLDALAAATAEVAALTAQLAAMQLPVNSFSRKQIKVALSDASLLDSFETTVADPQDGPQKLAMISWEEDDAFTQASPALVLTFARMNLTNEQITAIFVAAAKL